ncbi:TetR/AcrR family transcriptional regulator [Herbiconiux sp. L3-i23]|uniref:TetR/AcrR family transcriptional regulator n=1 Tax=Herbiconiux sp. L3-i23 TaxID=2905871 RepID=UPI002066786E|nr:TetR/AcrR family transcriptional regulator [Herbiconiux sp. L3-i23]BDI23406.1 TetR family transcriptional regulator [Herbiconiux sp. L3-i23]
MSEHRQGPVRSEAARRAILEATARQFEAKGYDHLTMEGIAAAAGVGKQTIYRWWPSRGALVAECLISGQLLPDRFGLPDTGDLRADLVAWLGTIFEFAADPSGEAVVRSLVAAAAENVDVGRRLHESLGATQSLVARLQSAVDSGELRTDAPLPDIGDALVGAMLLRALSRTTAEPGVAERLVDVVLVGLIAPR